MKRSLEISEKIMLERSGIKTEFKIEKIMGEGASCIAYRVSFLEDGEILHKGILKELFPSFLADKDFIRKDKEIFVPKEAEKEFLEEKQNFEDTYRNINEYLSNNLSAANFHTVQLGLYRGNNTLYTLTSCDFGEDYEKITDTDIKSIFKIMLAVTKAVKLYHDAGFLHLDIKPRNILVLNGVTDIIKLFDFDSLVSIEKIKKRQIKSIPNPGEYYVPELCNVRLRDIGTHTDIFEIGAIIFEKLFGRYPNLDELYHDSTYPMESSKVLKTVSPQAKYEIEKIFEKTIRISKRERFKTADELILALENVINLLNINDPYFINLAAWQPTTYFEGREDELLEIHKRLNEDGYVFVKGIGGLGKSEIAKKYIQKYKNNYHTVQFCKYNDSLRLLTASLAVKNVDETKFSDTNEVAKYKNNLLHTCDEHTIIIVDNFNVTYDNFLRDFLPTDSSSFKVIFTTRCSLGADYYNDKIMELSKLPMHVCKSIFLSHSNCSEENEAIEDIIRAVDYNTLILVLLSESIKTSKKSPEEILNLLNDQELDKENSIVFHEYDYLDEKATEYNKINAHLNLIFDISAMSQIQKELLKDLSLAPNTGISFDDLSKFCRQPNFTYSLVESIKASGWLEYVDDNIVLHPIISDLISLNDNIPKLDSYYRLVSALENMSETQENFHVSRLIRSLDIALQLERRFKYENIQRRAKNKIAICSIYKNLYNKSKAREYAEKAIYICQKENLKDLLPRAYALSARIEQIFGTSEKTIELCQNSIDASQNASKVDYDLIVRNIIVIGKTFDRNYKIENAIFAYLDAFSFAEKNKLKKYLSTIANCLAFDYYDIGNHKKSDYYLKLKEKYDEFSNEQDDSYENKYESTLMNNIRNLNFKGAKEEGNKIISEMKEQLGEDSPYYQYMEMENMFASLSGENVEDCKNSFERAIEFIERNFGSDSLKMAKFIADTIPFAAIHIGIDYLRDYGKRGIEICKKLNIKDNTSIHLEIKLEMANYLALYGYSDEAKDILKDVSFTGIGSLSFLMRILSIGCDGLISIGETDLVENACMEYLKKDVEIDYLQYLAYLHLAMVYRYKGDVKNAEKACDAMEPYIEKIKQSKDPKYMLGYYRMRALTFYDKKDIYKAIAAMNELFSFMDEDTKDDISFATAYSDRGILYSEIGELDKAIENHKICENIYIKNNVAAENFLPLYTNMLKYNVESLNLEECKNIIKKIKDLKPEVLECKDKDDLQVSNNIAMYEIYSGNYDEAEKIYKKIESISNKGRKTNQGELLFIYNFSLLYYFKRDYKTSIKKLDKFFKRYDADLFDVQGVLRIMASNVYVECLLLLKNYKRSIIFIEKEVKYLVRRYGENSKQILDFMSQNLIYFINCKDEYKGQKVIDLFKKAFPAEFDENVILERAGKEEKRIAENYGKNSFAMIEMLIKVSLNLLNIESKLSFEFADSAKNIAKVGGYTREMKYAQILNVWGFTYFKYCENINKNLLVETFEKSKRLLEEIGATNSSYYIDACSLLDNAKKIL